MATAGPAREQARWNETQDEFIPSQHEPICSRCGGLMVPEFCTDLLSSTGELDCPIARCVQCGDLVDPVIRRNRYLQHAIGTVRELRASDSPVDDRSV